MGEDLGGRWERFANSPIDDNAGRLIDAAQHHPATKVARDMDMTSASLYRHTAGVAAQHWITTQG
ncbi:hypothetical protein [Arthrobacter sp. MYb213]|uniref:hypothetical protein n=1 Tax=Arthrobacter sp. MYb213 TaxID=1848595 RepID=UPI0011B01C93|nr:hypothetical protein [Arthrobacter sp. MYb213]